MSPAETELLSRLGEAPFAKNTALSLLGRWEANADLLRAGRHIEFWSRRTLTSLLREVGFEDLRFMGLGRLPYLWMR